MPTPKPSIDRVVQIPVKQLLPDPDQPRQDFDKDELNALADNIRQRGIQQPILVRLGDKSQIIIKDGERRWRAAAIVKLKTVPVLLAAVDEDTVQRRLDQVAVNSLRSGLKPMELARSLAKMREMDKLTPNDIAARLAKQGMPMSNAEISDMVKLVDLPDWAGDLVNDETIPISAARAIAGIADKAVLPEVQKELKRVVQWRGRATVVEVTEAIEDAYRAVGIDLNRTGPYVDKPVLFDHKKACKGCPHLRSFNGGAYCMDKAGFQKKQAEAKEAGLGPGGKKEREQVATRKGEKPLTAKQQEKLDQEKASKRAGALEDKSSYYLHTWARGRILEQLPNDDSDLCQRLVEFAAAQRPGIVEYTMGHVDSSQCRKMRAWAGSCGYPTMSHFLKAQDGGGELYEALALELVRQLPLPEILEISHHMFGGDLSELWTVDQAYLDLLQKAELIQVASKHAALPEGRKSWDSLKLPELQAAILAVAATVGTPPMLAKLYREIEKREPEADLEDLDDDEDEGSDAGGDE